MKIKYTTLLFLCMCMLFIMAFCCCFAFNLSFPFLNNEKSTVIFVSFKFCRFPSLFRLFDCCLAKKRTKRHTKIEHKKCILTWESHVTSVSVHSSHSHLMLVNVGKLCLSMAVAIVQFKCNEATCWIFVTNCFIIFLCYHCLCDSDSFASQYTEWHSPKSWPFSRVLCLFSISFVAI